MAQTAITYTDKENSETPTLPPENDVTASDLNEIKSVVTLNGADAQTRLVAAEFHASKKSNPHYVSKLQVGLSEVTNVLQLPASYLDTDSTLAANSDLKVPSQKAVKAYIDSTPVVVVATTDATFQVLKSHGLVTIDNASNVTTLPAPSEKWKGSIYKKGGTLDVNKIISTTGNIGDTLGTEGFFLKNHGDTVDLVSDGTNYLIV